MRYKQIKQLIKESTSENQDLFEVKMTSGNLSKLAKAIPGVKVGLEFEMIVPGGDSRGSEDSQPDYDQDERVRDISDAVNFFDNGDMNDRSSIRRLREAMQDSYYEWRNSQLDEDWDRNGFEFFCEYLDREEPFDPEDYEERAEDEVSTEHPDVEPGSEKFGELVAEKLQEINSEYYQESWANQGYNYDRAREEFDSDHEADWDEEGWLNDQGIRTMSDVETEFGYVQWPYWTSSNDDEPDTKEVALDFMNAMGYKSVAVGSYHGWGGGYEKWNGSSWVKIGSDKPDDCFTVEPDGSLSGDNDGDVGLEFVSPPIPLEDIGTVMKKVQDWAGTHGAYTGESNATSMHTNISVPGYDLNKLDYLKAALLLGDEHVLRQFDRIGNTYAKPGIEKVKQLVKQKPEKAKELLDKMKSHLNAAASKLIHSGTTDKYTSINTKDNRVEFRSPGGDYLNDIADNPQKMIDTINRMVVTLDAAMDPNKYKEEYQKKLYKLLTGDLGSRKAETGDIDFDIVSKATMWNRNTRKQEPAFKTTVKAKTASEAFKRAKDTLPADAKVSEYNITPKKHPTPGNTDLLKYFSQYAAGELPKQALKSFVRSAQIQRKAERDRLAAGKYWWNVKRDGQRIEVVGKDELDAKLAAIKEWGLIATSPNLDSMTAVILRPYKEPVKQEGGLYSIFGPGGGLIVSVQTSSKQEALEKGVYWAQRRGEEVVVKNEQGEEVGRVSAAGVVTPTTQGGSGIGVFYKMYDTRGTLIAGDEYASEFAALERARYWALRRDTEVIVKNDQGEEIGRVSASGVITHAASTSATLNGQPSNPDGNFIILPVGRNTPVYRFSDAGPDAAQDWLDRWTAEHPGNWRLQRDSSRRYGQPGGQGLVPQVRRWDIVNNNTGDVVQVFTGGTEDDAAQYAMDNYGHRFIFTTRPSDGEIQRAGNQIPNYYIKDRDTDEIVKGYFADDTTAAHEYLTQWKRDNNVTDRDYVYGRVSALPAAIQRNLGVIGPAQGSGPTTQLQPSNPAGNYVITNRDALATPVYRFMVANMADATEVLDQWRAEHPDEQWVVMTDPNQRLGQPAATSQQSGSGEYGVWITSSERFARLPADQANGDPNTLRTFPSREAADEYLSATRANNPRMRSDIEVREIPQGYELPAPLGRPVSPAFGGPATATATATQGNAVNYEIYNRHSGAEVDSFTASSDEEALATLNNFRSSSRHSMTPEQALLAFGVRRGPGVDNTSQTSSVNNLTPHGPGPWEIYDLASGESILTLAHTNRNAAETEARSSLEIANRDSSRYGVRTQRPEQAPRTLTTPGLPQQQFTGEWKIVDPDGNEIYRFSGVGNVQADANNVAMAWLRRNPQQMQSGVEVLPVMG